MYKRQAFIASLVGSDMSGTTGWGAHVINGGAKGWSGCMFAEQRSEVVYARWRHGMGILNARKWGEPKTIRGRRVYM